MCRIQRLLFAERTTINRGFSQHISIWFLGALVSPDFSQKAGENWCNWRFVPLTSEILKLPFFGKNQGPHKIGPKCILRLISFAVMYIGLEAFDGKVRTDLQMDMFHWTPLLFQCLDGHTNGLRANSIEWTPC